MNGTANGVSVHANSTFLSTDANGAISEALGGAAGTGTAVGGAIAITYVENTTNARIGTGAGNFTMTGGALSVTADHTADIVSNADAEVAGAVCHRPSPGAPA